MNNLKHLANENMKLKDKIAELEANLHEAIQLLHGSQADAIREMLDSTNCIAFLSYSFMYEYADKLEKSDG